MVIKEKYTFYKMCLLILLSNNEHNIHICLKDIIIKMKNMMAYFEIELTGPFVIQGIALTRKKFETQIGDEREAEYLYYSKTSTLKVVKHVSEKSQSWFVQFVAMLIAHYSHSLSTL